jgi:hypothetical protein
MGMSEFAGLIQVAKNAKEDGLTLHIATRGTCDEHLAAGDDEADESRIATIRSETNAQLIALREALRMLTVDGRYSSPDTWEHALYVLGDTAHAAAESRAAIEARWREGLARIALYTDHDEHEPGEGPEPGYLTSGCGACMADRALLAQPEKED